MGLVKHTWRYGMKSTDENRLILQQFVNVNRPGGVVGMLPWEIVKLKSFELNLKWMFTQNQAKLKSVSKNGS